DLQRAALVPVEPLALYDAEALALEDVHRLLAVGVAAGMPAHGDLSLQHVAAHGREPIRVAHHELDLRVLPRLDPGDVPVPRHMRRAPKLLLDLAVSRQPLV